MELFKGKGRTLKDLFGRGSGALWPVGIISTGNQRKDFVAQSEPREAGALAWGNHGAKLIVQRWWNAVARVK